MCLSTPLDSLKGHRKSWSNVSLDFARFTQGVSKKAGRMCLSTPLDSLKGHRKSWSSGAEKSLLKLAEMSSIHSKGIEKAGRAACAEPGLPRACRRAEVSREKLAKVSRDALDKMNEASRVFRSACAKEECPPRRTRLAQSHNLLSSQDKPKRALQSALVFHTTDRHAINTT